MSDSLEFGAVVGETIHGVIAYSDGPAPGGSLSGNPPRHFNGSIDGQYNTGVAWEAIEFVRRFTVMAKGVMLPAVPSPAALWDIQRAPILTPGGGWAPVSPSDNGASSGSPAVGDIVVWQRGLRHPNGHVAVVVHVTSGGDVYIAEQGPVLDGKAWPHEGYSRKLFLRGVNGMQYLTEKADDATGGDILGWLHVMASFVNLNESDVPDRFRRAQGEGTVRRVGIERDLSIPWVDKTERCGFFLRRSLIPDGKSQAAHPEEVPSGYYILDYDLWQRIHVASVELHNAFIKTTRELIMDPEAASVLEVKFGIPTALHPLLRASLNYPCFSGRFDIGYDGKHLHVFEYNCDSSAALLETAQTQQQIAAHYGFDKIGSSGGAALNDRMVEWWSRIVASSLCPKTKTVHFLVDDDDEERYTALCVMRAAEAAGLRCKLCVKLVDFKFAQESNHPPAPPPPHAAPHAALPTSRRVVDLEGIPVLLVWKTWSWTTIVNDFNKHRAARLHAAEGPHSSVNGAANFGRTDSDASGSSASPPQSTVSGVSATTATAPSAAGSAATNSGASAKPTLSDVLLSPYTVVLEPLWKAVASSKALLPYVHESLPDHPSILPAYFELNESLQAAHVRKPVHGRGGANVTVHDGRDGDTVTQGNFADDVVVYQAKCDVKKFDDYYPILCSWVIGSTFSGATVREDKSRVTSLASCVAPVRVVRSKVIQFTPPQVEVASPEPSAAA